MRPCALPPTRRCHRGSRVLVRELTADTTSGHVVHDERTLGE